jgi:hypothetical protein
MRRLARPFDAFVDAAREEFVARAAASRWLFVAAEEGEGAPAAEASAGPKSVCAGGAGGGVAPSRAVVDAAGEALRGGGEGKNYPRLLLI